MRIVDDGRFAIPLFHGTSTVFIDSIRETGLGGSNPLVKSDHVRRFGRLLRLCDSVLKDVGEWQHEKFVLESFADQEITNGGFNFQHGDTYLTPSRQSAVSYALRNRLGSEFLSIAEMIYEKARKVDPRAFEDTAFAESPLLDYFGIHAEPILITVHGVRLETVLGERGEPPDENVAMLENLAACMNGFLVELSQGKSVFNYNFRLLEPVPFDQLVVAALDPSQEEIIGW